MVSNRICFCWHKYIPMIIYFLTLFASTSIFTQEGFMAEGRTIPTLTEASKRGMEEQGFVRESKAQIGSRPPRCEGRCRSCGRCEAVQVPVIPQVQSHSRSRTTNSATTAIPHSRGDDLSNYKPMSWKCKCGNFFFNP
ncbi:EPIDERMAL PATTERNING FACTOR-like protein 2 [Neltuma alba]|uniref:EPIDERMAL PATTERNING FACTOR-like protein 2 n=1 Tax=Neltuma alba TaxID=207710 RepID=UPI0010A31590|nr:EPIDERMAL PATTERNING FACTOR-like protein 2 [Prosopis alba]